MALIEVLEIKQREVGHGLLFRIDRPEPGTTREAHAIDVAGWAIGGDPPVHAIEVVDEDGRYIKTFRRARADVIRHYPELAGPRPGFWIGLGLLGLPQTTTLEVHAVLADGHREVLGEVRLRHAPPRRGAQRFRPLAVTSTGRTGTTLLMRLLSEHPRIAVYRQYPFELRPAKYWLHTLRVVCEMANHADPDYNENFDTVTSFIGHHPFYTAVLPQQELRDWFARDYIERLAEFCRQSIDESYQRIAAVQGSSRALFFCEKYNPDRSPRLLNELYPDAREIILVRDFRDVLCSINEFNARRGTAEFGRSSVASDEQYIGYLGAQVQLLLRAWKERCSRAHLVRYEDLVTDPLRVLRAITDYLGVETRDAELEDAVTRAMSDSAELAEHRTSTSRDQSIGRWRQQLSAAHLALAESVFAPALREFGYQ